MKLPKLLETPNYTQDSEGRIPYVLFNVYVPWHRFFFLTKYVFILITGQGLKAL